jgi:hypothetical protein
MIMCLFPSLVFADPFRRVYILTEVFIVQLMYKEKVAFKFVTTK